MKCTPGKDGCILQRMINDAQVIVDSFSTNSFFGAFPTYQEYLNSDHWQSLRTEALEHYSNKCMLCSSIDKLDVHHNNYDNLGNETMTDVIVFCRACHGKHHNK